MAKNYVAGESRNISLTVGQGVPAGIPINVRGLFGTTVTQSDGAGRAVVDVSPTATYKHPVRNVTAYNGGVEVAWSYVFEGVPVYYDPSSTMPEGVRLSLSKLDNEGNENQIFGRVVGGTDSTTTAKTVPNVEILQDRTPLMIP